MGTLNDAAVNARALYAQFKALIAVGEAITEINDLEKAQAEARQVLADLQRSVADMHVEHELLEANIEKAKEELGTKRAEAASLVPAANIQAVSIKNAAEKEAKDIREKASAEHEAFLKRADEERRAAEDSAFALKTKLMDEINALTVSRDTLVAEIAALRKRLEGV